MKKAISLLLVLVFMVTLCSCGSRENETDSHEGDWEFINQYDESGHISCDRVWVIKTESSWDQEPQKYLAYFGPKGQLIYGWKPLGYLQPFDYKNGYAFVEDNETGVLTILDLDGNELFADTKRVYVGAETGVHCVEGDWINHRLNLTNFNENGRAYFIGYVWDITTSKKEEKGYYVIDKTGIYRFKADLTYLEDLVPNTHELGDKIFVSDGILYSVLFDTKGEVLLDFRESLDIAPKTIELEGNDKIRAHFIGKDDKPYVCVVDYHGNFVEEPTPDNSATN